MKTFNSIGDYEKLQQIGRGSNSTVYKAMMRKTAEICAIKKIRQDTSDLARLTTEIHIICHSKCKNIVRFLACGYSDKEVLIAMEYCCGGSVKDVMRRLGRTMSQEQIVVILKDVLNALDYLHSGIKVHKDVKAANILLNEDGIAKLGDFGISESLEDTNETKRPISGTLLWLPPEVIKQDRNYSTAIDIWSLGITIIEMADGAPPYQNLDQNDPIRRRALKEIADLEKPAPTFKCPSHWSQGLLNFLSYCLDKDASRRKTAKELLNCDLIKEAPSNSVIKSLVDEVISTAHSASNSEAELYEELNCLSKEVQILLKVAQERKKKVIRVDHLKEGLASAQRKFNELSDRIELKHANIVEMKAQTKTIVEENQKLEREWNELKNSKDSLSKRKSDIQYHKKKIMGNLADRSF